MRERSSSRQSVLARVCLLLTSFVAFPLVAPRLAGYFETRELGDRKVDELPWQLSRAGSWKRLYDLLGDLRFFAALCHAEKTMLLRYWLQVEDNSTNRMIDAFMKAVELGAAVALRVALKRQSRVRDELRSIRDMAVPLHLDDYDRVARRLSAALTLRGQPITGREAMEIAGLVSGLLRHSRTMARILNILSKEDAAAMEHEIEVLERFKRCVDVAAEKNISFRIDF